MAYDRQSPSPADEDEQVAAAGPALPGDNLSASPIKFVAFFAFIVSDAPHLDMPAQPCLLA